jgi:hypothetical protein
MIVLRRWLGAKSRELCKCFGNEQNETKFETMPLRRDVTAQQKSLLPPTSNHTAIPCQRSR